MNGLVWGLSARVPFCFSSYAALAGLELEMLFLPLPPKDWGYKYVPLQPFYRVLGVRPKASPRLQAYKASTGSAELHFQLHESLYVTKFILSKYFLPAGKHVSCTPLFLAGAVASRIAPD